MQPERNTDAYKNIPLFFLMGFYFININDKFIYCLSNIAKGRVLHKHWDK